MSHIEQELKRQENFTTTENGAIAYKTTGSALVDINYKVSSFRNSSEEEIIASFDKAYYENKEYALKWLFFARDIREGLGERRLFRICYKRLADLDPHAFFINLEHIAEYGRWDDLIILVGIDDVIDERITAIIRLQLYEDLNNIKENKSVSLLGKWLPSENASSKETKKMARKVRKLLNMSSRHYRLMLSNLRKHIDVVEVKMCDNNWSDIDYEKVPSLANLKYKNAFMVHDGERRREYLSSVAKGTSKINMKVATPVDIVTKYMPGWRMYDYDDTLELAWKNLKDIINVDSWKEMK